MTAAQWCFVVLVGASVLLVLASRVKSQGGVSGFYTGGGHFKAWQNGLALSGDYLSAAAFLGAAGMVVSQGYDSLVYAVGTLAGWPLLMLLLAEPLRRQGRYTVADVLEQHFPQRSVRLMTSLTSLLVCASYLTIQMVAGGKMMSVLFGFSYPAALAVVSVLILLYVLPGGMRATTWIQMIKAVLLLGSAALLAVGTLLRGGDPATLVHNVVAVHPAGAAILQPSSALGSPWEVLSLGLGLVLGLLGLPHILMRFFTVADPATARHSVAWATGLIALMFTFNALIGAGAILYVMTDPLVHDAGGKVIGGGNMVLLHLAKTLWGPMAQAAISAIAFATLLAVVAGLTMAGAATLGHSVYARLWCRTTPSEPRLLLASRLGAVLLVASGAGLALLLEQQNVAFLLGLAFAIAASSQAPVLLLTLYWPGFTRQGALWTGWVGMLAATLAILTGPALFPGHGGLHFPLANPALFSVPLACLAGLAASWLERRRNGS